MAERNVAYQGSEGNAVKGWSNDANSFFYKLPSLLEGVTFFKTIQWNTPIEDNQLNISLYRPSTVFIAAHSSYDGNFNLVEGKWKLFSASGSLRIKVGSYDLNHLFMKKIQHNEHGETTIELGRETNHFVGVIFVNGKKLNIL